MQPTFNVQKIFQIFKLKNYFCIIYIQFRPIMTTTMFNHRVSIEFYFESDWSRIRPLPSTTLINIIQQIMYISLGVTLIYNVRAASVPSFPKCLRTEKHSYRPMHTHTDKQ